MYEVWEVCNSCVKTTWKFLSGRSAFIIEIEHSENCQFIDLDLSAKNSRNILGKLLPECAVTRKYVYTGHAAVSRLLQQHA